jgi:hypothetical protein
MSSCFSRCLRVPIAIRAFYESYLWILPTLLLTHPDLHPGLLRDIKSVVEDWEIGKTDVWFSRVIEHEGGRAGYKKARSGSHSAQ